MNRLPLIVAITLLLLPALYMASYLAMVIPGGVYVLPDGNEIREGQISELDAEGMTLKTYRVGGGRTEIFFWPIEQVDRRLRSKQWHEPIVWWMS